MLKWAMSDALKVVMGGKLSFDGKMVIVLAMGMALRDLTRVAFMEDDEPDGRIRTSSLEYQDYIRALKVCVELQKNKL